MTRQTWKAGWYGGLAATLMICGQARAVEYANIDVVDGVAPTYTTPPTVSIPGGQSTPGFNIEAGSVVGEIPIRIGTLATDDANNGILVVTARETVRNPIDGPV